MDAAAQRFLADMKKMAREMCGSNGARVQLLKYNPVNNPVTGGVNNGIPASNTPFAVVFPPSVAGNTSAAAFSNQLDEMILAQRELRYVILDAGDLTLKPEALDTIVFPDGSKWEVLGSDPVGVFTSVVIYGVGLVKL